MTFSVLTVSLLLRIAACLWAFAELHRWRSRPWPALVTAALLLVGSHIWNIVGPGAPIAQGVWSLGLVAVLDLLLLAILWRISSSQRVYDRRDAARRAAEKAMLETLLNNPDPVCLVDAKTNRFALVNPAFGRLVGIPPERAVGQVATEVGVWSDMEQRRELLRRILEQGFVHSFTWSETRADGDRWVHRISATLLDLERGPMRLFLVHDLSERIKAEKALVASEERYSAAFRDSPDGIVISTLAEGRLIDVNRGFERLTGYQRDEVLGKTTAEIELWANPEQRRKLVKMLSQGASFRGITWTFRNRHGGMVDCRVSGARVEIDGEACLVAVACDIGKLIAAQEERASLIRELEAGNLALEQFTATVSRGLREPLDAVHGHLAGMAEAAEVGQEHLFEERLEAGASAIRKTTGEMARLLDGLLEPAERRPHPSTTPAHPSTTQTD